MIFGTALIQWENLISLKEIHTRVMGPLSPKEWLWRTDKLHTVLFGMGGDQVLGLMTPHKSLGCLGVRNFDAAVRAHKFWTDDTSILSLGSEKDPSRVGFASFGDFTNQGLPNVESHPEEQIRCCLHDGVLSWLFPQLQDCMNPNSLWVRLMNILRVFGLGEMQDFMNSQFPLGQADAYAELIWSKRPAKFALFPTFHTRNSFLSIFQL